jgi:hypothetical protein
VGYFLNSTDFGDGAVASAGSRDMFIVKTSSVGTLLWKMTTGNVQIDTLQSVAVDSNDNIIVGGQFRVSLTIQENTVTSAGASDTLLAKFNSSGGLIWAKSFGSASGDSDAKAVTVDSSNNILVTGSFGDSINFGGATLSSSGGNDIYLVKFSPNGALLWSKRFGGFSDDSGMSISTDVVGNIFIGATIGGSIDFGGGITGGGGGVDAALVKFESSGAFLWSRSISGASGDSIATVTCTSSGNVVVAGYATNNADFGDGQITCSSTCMFTAHYNAAGTFQWERHTVDYLATAYGIGVDVSDNVYVAGYVDSRLSLETGNAVSVIDNGLSCYLLKLSSDGSYVWEQRQIRNSAFGASEPCSVYGVSVGTNVVIIGGKFAGGPSTLDFGSTILSNPSTSVTNFEGFVAAYNQS